MMETLIALFVLAVGVLGLVLVITLAFGNKPPEPKKPPVPPPIARLPDPEPEKPPALPRHLSALIGSLRGPADLGRNHDKYLTYADREEAGGAASA